jgi:acyl-homoserine-lactone acylase
VALLDAWNNSAAPESEGAVLFEAWWRRYAQGTAELPRRYGRSAIPWGEVHRVRIGGKDPAEGGCGGDLGCFRVLQFGSDPDGKLSVRGGDGWILAVEFGD